MKDMEPMGWQDTERGHTGMAGVGTEVGGREGRGGGRERGGTRIYGNVRRGIQQTGAQRERVGKKGAGQEEQEVGRIDGWKRGMKV